MNKIIVLLVGVLLVFSSQAQITMTPQVPPTGVLLKKQLWNLALVYTGNNPIYIRINITLSSAANDQPMLTATTTAFSISAGAKQVQVTDLTITYQYLSSLIQDRDPDGYLPIGAYQACYTVILSDELNSTPLAEDCIYFEVEPVSPPQLNSPADEDTVTTTYPQFSWLNPAPLSLFNNLSYRFCLVEVQNGQSAASAIQQNIPLYSNYNCSDIFLNYPSSGLALDTGKLYAWQVIAQNNLQPTAQSEVWTFRIKSSDSTLPVNDDNYILLNNDGEGRGVYTSSDGRIKIKYISEDDDHDADIKFMDAEGKVIKTMKQRIVYGENYLNLKLDNSFVKDTTYYFVMADLAGNKYSASFEIE